MQKLYLAILPIISFSLAGMGTDNNQETQRIDHDHTLVFKPRCGFLTLTQEKAHIIKDHYGLHFNTDHLIHTQVIEHTKTLNNKTVFLNSEKHRLLRQRIPNTLPLDMFTQGKTYTVIIKDPKNQKNVIVKLSGDNTYPENSFVSYEEYFKLLLNNNQ